jgi:hypothetical protein
MSQRRVRSKVAAAVVVATTAGVALGVAGGQGASAQSSTADARTKVTYTIGKVQVKAVGKAVPLMGDRRITSGALTTGGKESASFGLDCHVVRIGVNAGKKIAISQCLATVATEKGQVTAQGLAADSLSTTLAITGGYGPFEGAKGSLAIGRSGKKSTITLDYTR